MLATDDIDGFVDIIDSHGVEIGTAYPDRLQAMLEALPEHVLRAHPRLAVARHAISTFFDQAKPRAGFDLAEQLRDMAATGTPVGDLIMVGIGQIFSMRATGQLAEGLPIVERDRARAEANRADWLEVPGETRSIVLLQWGLTRMLAQDVEGAVQDFQECYWAGRRSRVPYFSRNGAINAALMLVLLDSLDDAEAWLAKGRELDRAPEAIRTIVEEWDPLVEALLALARLRVDDARRALAEFRPAPDTELSWSIEHFVRARAGLLSGEYFGALDELARAHHPRGGTASPGSFDEALLTTAEVELALAIGRVPRAAALLDRVGGVPLLTVARARLALLAGDPAEAHALCVAGLHHATTFGRIDLAAIGAVALLHLGRREEAAEKFARAIELVRVRGAVAAFALLPRADVEALMELVPAGAELLVPVLETTPAPAVDRVAVVELSEREKLVLKELARTGSTQQIAARLFVSVNTIKSQVRSIYRKLGANSRDGALEAAHRWGFDLGPSGR